MNNNLNRNLIHMRNEQLEVAIANYNSGRIYNTWKDLMDIFTLWIFLGIGCIYVEVYFDKHISNEERGRMIREGYVNKPRIKRLVKDDGKAYIPCYTNYREFSKESGTIYLGISFEELMTIAIKADDCFGIVINPFDGPMLVRNDVIERILGLDHDSRASEVMRYSFMHGFYTKVKPEKEDTGSSVIAVYPKTAHGVWYTEIMFSHAHKNADGSETIETPEGRNIIRIDKNLFKTGYEGVTAKLMYCPYAEDKVGLKVVVNPSDSRWKDFSGRYKKLHGYADLIEYLRLRKHN